jgi:outer membrane protein assembly factor BamE (lipoprotein component of BamABCDE complex)
VAVACIGLAAACSPIVRTHGYVPPDDDLAEITVGRDTRETVAETLGSPGASGVIGDQGYYYVSQVVRQRGYRDPEVVDREIVAISFDAQGVVRNVERFGLEDGNVVALSRRVTDSNVQGIGFLRQLLGNLGRINLEDLGGG